jgi:hypothetical protein
MKKVLIITYYWPPIGGGGVQRWLKTSKYLRDYNWEPVICTAKDPEISMYDESLEADVLENLEVLRVPIWEPFKLYRFITGQKHEKVNPGFLKKSNRVSFFEDISLWIRGNIFIPDAKRFWYRPSVKSLTKYLQNNKVDVIVSTGPPHTTHLIALDISKKFKIPWLADFRDPWTKIDFFHKLKLSSRANKIHKNLELNVLKTADVVSTVSESWSNDFLKISGIKPLVINNGYDPADFIDISIKKLDNKFSITHAGSMNADRNPNIFWQALKFLINEDSRFKRDLNIKLIGPVDITVINSIKKYDLNDYVTYIDNLCHDEVVKLLVSSQLLLLPLNNSPNVSGIIPGKTYEYIAAQRPILCIGDINGDTAKILNNINAGSIVGFDDYKLIKDELLRFYNLYKAKKLNVNSSNFEIFSRKELASKFSSIFNDMSNV